MDIATLMQSLQQTADTFTTQDIVLSTVLSFVLSLAIGWVYKTTYRGTSYTQSFVHTLVIMSMVVALIMLIIGSNIARAFSLVGALSIIRFRNAVKDSRDVAFVFFAMAIGMACGTRFYQVAIIATGIISGLILAMVRMDLFAHEVRSQILKLRFPAGMPYDTLLAPLFDRYLNRFNLVAMETVQAGTQTELIYSVEMKEPGQAQDFLADLGQVNANNKVVLITGQQEVDL